MNNVQSIVRSLATYAICIPLAVFLGYMLAEAGGLQFWDRGTYITISLVLAALCLPLFLKLHYSLMLLVWNTTAIAFFIPGRPQLWLAAIPLSFAITFTHRIMNKDVSMIRIPQLTRPLILLVLVVVVTAELRGGFGVRSLGGEVFGGKRYFYLLLAILGYFALTAQRIPRERANLYVALFFLGGASCMIGDLYQVLGNSLPFVFLLIPPYTLSPDSPVVGISRLGGTTAASAAFFYFMLARYGMRGIFQEGKPLRLLWFILFAVLGMFGGYRSLIIAFAGVFIVQFFLEGMHRTKLFPTMILIVAVAGALALPFATKLPPTVQRALAFLPLQIDPMVRESAEGSSDWRLRMWKAVLPQVPEYLFLGKGLAMSQADMAFVEQFQANVLSEDQYGSALAGDYHNGPLSVVIPFGIWGVIAFVWFQVAGFQVLIRNHRHGDPALKVVNSMLLASFIVKTIMFWLIVGGLYSDMLTFAGWLGLSVALNNGVAQASPAVVRAETGAQRLATLLPTERPIFGR